MHAITMFESMIATKKAYSLFLTFWDLFAKEDPSTLRRLKLNKKPTSKDGTFPLEAKMHTVCIIKGVCMAAVYSMLHPTSDKQA